VKFDGMLGHDTGACVKITSPLMEMLWFFAVVEVAISPKAEPITIAATITTIATLVTKFKARNNDLFRY
jgi:hypothetical protein